MAETGDILNEWKQAKPPERVVIVLVVIAIIGVSWYLYQKSKAQSSSTPAQGATSGQQAGYPTVGPNGTPVLPYGVTPNYDPNGNLVSFSNPPPPGTTPPPSPGGGFTWPSALTGMKIWQGTTTHQYFFGPNGPQPGRANQTALSTLFPTGTTFSGSTGSPLSYTLPGSTTPIQSTVTLSNPVPKAPMISSQTQLVKTAGGGSH